MVPRLGVNGQHAGAAHYFDFTSNPSIGQLSTNLVNNARKPKSTPSSGSAGRFASAGFQGLQELGDVVLVKLLPLGPDERIAIFLGVP
jgi:hypothetical protein